MYCVDISEKEEHFRSFVTFLLTWELLFVRADGCKVTSCLAMKCYIQQHYSLENVHVGTHITFERIINLIF